MKEDLYECEACSAKSGAPTLCVDCLQRRAQAGAAWKGQRPHPSDAWAPAKGARVRLVKKIPCTAPVGSEGEVTIVWEPNTSNGISRPAQYCVDCEGWPPFVTDASNLEPVHCTNEASTCNGDATLRPGHVYEGNVCWRCRRVHGVATYCTFCHGALVEERCMVPNCPLSTAGDVQRTDNPRTLEPGDRVAWRHASIDMGIGTVEGVRQLVSVRWDGMHCAVEYDAGHLIAQSPKPRPETPRVATGEHFFPMPDAKKCEGCGGSARVELNVSRSGYTVGSGYEHTEACPKTKCPHGVPWMQWADCKECPE